MFKKFSWLLAALLMLCLGTRPSAQNVIGQRLYNQMSAFYFATKGYVKYK